MQGYGVRTRVPRGAWAGYGSRLGREIEQGKPPRLASDGGACVGLMMAWVVPRRNPRKGITENEKEI